ncbi:GTP-binding protein [Oribacterium sp. HCP28S3_H8]|uniref:GTP-binding protein n=1 Tax=Oribacterium sp. HCP28S3_H8 TaxID=3438945 RepID=UPI003F8C91DB
MTRIDIVSGFLGAGKTTFIQRLLDEALKTQKVVLIENEFGEIGIDGGFLKESGIEIREMNQGCICCSLVGDFEKSLTEVVNRYQPDRIIIEPSGVGKLSDIIGAVKTVSGKLDVVLDAAVTVVDAKKAKLYSRNFGEFFNNQILYAGTVVLSRTDIADDAKIEEAVKIVKEINPKATVITTPEEKLTGEQLINIISGKDTLEDDMMKEVMDRVHEHEHEEEDDDDHDVIETLSNGISIHHHHDHHHHHHEHDHEAHEHDHEEEHDHDHHDHDHDEHDHDHHDHEDHDHEHHEHEHHHHHNHDADEVFTNWGMETPHPFSKAKLAEILKDMSDSDKFGTVVRCKGMLEIAEEKGKWMYFDLVPGQTEIREGSPEYTGKVVVIGSDLKEDVLKQEFCGEN